MPNTVPGESVTESWKHVESVSTLETNFQTIILFNLQHTLQNQKVKRHTTSFDIVNHIVKQEYDIYDNKIIDLFPS